MHLSSFSFLAELREDTKSARHLGEFGTFLVVHLNDKALLDNHGAAHSSGAELCDREVEL